jgi:hypothetical protein
VVGSGCALTVIARMDPAYFVVHSEGSADINSLVLTIA